jgi:pyruvate,water dikinase
LYYRNRKKIKQTSVNLGVLVQPMLHASAAGMMFTANPHNGATEELVVESIWGLGEPATSARVRPDRFVIDKKTGAVKSSELTSKLVKLDLAPDGHLQQLGVPEGQQDTPSLGDETLSRLAELGRQIEELFSAPQEIEWAFADQKLSILQTRPIGQRI